MAADPTPLKPQCDEALHELYHLLSGEIDDQKRAKIAAHLDECSPCAEPYDFYAELQLVIKEKCHDEPPPELFSKIAGLFESEPPVEPGQR